VDCSASPSLSIFCRDNPGVQWLEFSQRPCHVLCCILGIALLFRCHPLQREPLVAYGAVDYFRAVCCAGWSLAHLPWRSLGQRCTGRLPAWFYLACYVPLALSLCKRQRCACSKWQANQAFSSKVCKTSYTIAGYATLNR